MPVYRTARGWVERKSSALLTWVIVAVSFILGYASYLRFKPSFVPDSRYYLAFAFWFGGDTQQQAHDKVVAFAANYGISVPDTKALFGWGLVQPRVMLSLIAAPAVRVFGPFGLAMTTGFITLVLTVLLTLVIMRRYGNTAAAVTLAVINASTYVMWYNSAMLTESLSAVWSVLIVLVAWRFQHTRQWWLLGALALVTALSAFTRQATLIDAGALLMAWVLGSLFERRNSPWMWPAIVVTVASLGCQLLQTIVFPFSQSNQFEAVTGTHSLPAALLASPKVAYHILHNDLQNFAGDDRSLLFFVVMSVVGMVLFFRREESHLLFGAILAIAVYNVTNGTPTAFRYAIPGLVFYALVFAMLISRTAQPVQDRHGRAQRAAVDDETPIAAS